MTRPHSTTGPHGTDRQYRRYLLNRLSTAEQDAVELQLLTDDDAYRKMSASEDELLDAYVRDELTAEERRAFEDHLLPRPGMGERLAFARALQIYGEQAAEGMERRADAGTVGWKDRLAAWLGTLVPAPAPALRVATAALALILLVTTGWLAWHNAGLSRQMAELRSEHSELAAERRSLAESRDRLAGELAAARSAAADRQATAEELATARERARELEEELATLRRPRQQPRREPVAVSFLLALATRSAGTPELVVPPAADVVRLQLDTAGDDAYFDSFRVRLLGRDGAQVWSRTGLSADAETGVVGVELAAELLPAGRYEVLLEGSAGAAAPELIGAYEFEVRR